MARSDVAHYEGLTYWGPLSVARMEAVLALLEVPEGAQVLDVGCGRGELLVRLGERCGAQVTGVDRSGAALAMVREAFAARCPALTPTLVQREVAGLAFDTDSFDLILWLGGPYLYKSFEETIETLRGWARPGGLILLGHGFWASAPPEAYLEATGIDAGEFGAHWENIAACERAGGTLLYTCISDRDEWDAFEGRILYNHERYAAAHPDAPGIDAVSARRRAWNMAQQRWGRDAMGFGLYLVQAPA